jgi:hypothetical protein
MASPTRDEFLSYVHTPLTNTGEDPDSGSPTKSAMRCRWNQLQHWDVEVDANGYWEAMSDDDRHATLTVRLGYWDHVAFTLSNYTEPFISEPTLRSPFDTAYRNPHNVAIRGATDAHADMWPEGSGSNLTKPPITRSDLVFVYDGRLTGVGELKCWWNVTEAEFEEVKVGI